MGLRFLSSVVNFGKFELFLGLRKIVGTRKRNRSPRNNSKLEKVVSFSKFEICLGRGTILDTRKRTNLIFLNSIFFSDLVLFWMLIILLIWNYFSDLVSFRLIPSQRNNSKSEEFSTLERKISEKDRLFVSLQNLLCISTTQKCIPKKNLALSTI